MMSYEMDCTRNIRPFKTICPGRVGGVVYQLKRLLNEKVCCQTKSGEYDEICRLAVQTFQVTHNLTVSGSVDEATWVALNKSDA